MSYTRHICVLYQANYCLRTDDQGHAVLSTGRWEPITAFGVWGIRMVDSCMNGINSNTWQARDLFLSSQTPSHHGKPAYTAFNKVGRQSY